MTTHNPPAHLVASPGEVLEEWLEERHMTQRELAERMAMSQKFVSQLINGKASLTPDTAQNLELVTSVSAGTWLRMEATYRAVHKRAQAVEAAAESPVDAAFVKVLREAGIVTAPPRSRGEQTLQVWEFLGVASTEALAGLSRRRLASFRNSATLAPDPVATEITIALALRQASQSPVPPLDTDRLREVLPQLRSFTLLGAVAGSASARELLATAGLALVFLPNVPRAHCNGLTLWQRESAVIAITDRGRKEDIFWFTLFHELSHVLDGDREAIYLDGSGVGAERPEAETRADDFSTELLIPRDREHLLATVTSASDLGTVADALGLSRGVVVGQLHHRGLKDFNWGNQFIERIVTRPAS